MVVNSLFLMFHNLPVAVGVEREGWVEVGEGVWLSPEGVGEGLSVSQQGLVPFLVLVKVAYKGGTENDVIWLVLQFHIFFFNDL